jgi:hypothetical protein
MDTKLLYSTLTYAGVTPFLACALLPLIGISSLPPFGPLDQLVNSYGLAIVCFLAGIHWANYLNNQDVLPFNLMISSNVVFLVAWFAYVLGELSWSLVIQIVALFILLLIDWRLKSAAVITAHYFRARFIATALASAALALVIIN